MDRSVELHLAEANRLTPTNTEAAWHIGQVVYHLLQIVNIQERRISALEQIIEEAK